jgi:hypothetical protein
LGFNTKSAISWSKHAPQSYAGYITEMQGAEKNYKKKISKKFDRYFSTFFGPLKKFQRPKTRDFQSFEISGFFLTQKKINIVY